MRFCLIRVRPESRRYFKNRFEVDSESKSKLIKIDDLEIIPKAVLQKTTREIIKTDIEIRKSVIRTGNIYIIII